MFIHCHFADLGIQQIGEKMKHSIETSKEHSCGISDEVFHNASIYVRGNHLEWVFRSNKEAERAMKILIRAGFNAVRRVS